MATVGLGLNVVVRSELVWGAGDGTVRGEPSAALPRFREKPTIIAAKGRLTIFPGNEDQAVVRPRAADRNDDEFMHIGLRVFSFAIAGGLGYLVDVAVLLAAAPFAGPYLGRLISFGSAVFATWSVNSRLTFRDRRGAKSLAHQFVQYVLVCLGGGVVNLLAYSLLVLWLEPPTAWLPAAVAVGSLAGMVVNYTLADRLVFARNRSGLR